MGQIQLCGRYDSGETVVIEKRWVETQKGLVPCYALQGGEPVLPLSGESNQLKALHSGRVITLTVPAVDQAVQRVLSRVF